MFPKTKVPLILQSEVSECGLACIAMVLGYYGSHTSIFDLRSKEPSSLRGVSIMSLARLASTFGMTARALRVGPKSLGKLRLPCILHWGLNHFVVLVACGDGHFVVNDPARGTRKVGPMEVSENLTGVVLELLPTSALRRMRMPRIRLREIIGPVIGLRRAVSTIVVIALALEMISLALPIFLQLTIDEVVPSHDNRFLASVALGFGVVVALQAALIYARGWTLATVSASINIQWLASAFSHLSRLPMSFFEKRYSADISARFASIGHIQRTLAVNFVESCIDGTMVLVMLVVMLSMDAVLGAIAACGLTTLAVARLAQTQQLYLASEQRLHHTVHQQQHLQETVSGMQSTKLFQRESTRLSGWLAHVSRQIRHDLEYQHGTLVGRVANVSISGLERILFITFGSMQVMSGKETVGALLMLLTYNEACGIRLSLLLDRLIEFRLLGMHKDRLADIVLAEPEAEGNLTSLPDQERSIVFDNVSFRYAGESMFVFRDCSFSIREGECVAIIGPSGCGKTTLLKIMLGLLPPTSGRVFWAGVELSSLSADAYRSLVATVMQDDRLFSGTIAENISFFDDKVDEEALVRCSAAAGIHADITKLPMGFTPASSKAETPSRAASASACSSPARYTELRR